MLNEQTVEASSFQPQDASEGRRRDYQQALRDRIRLINRGHRGYLVGILVPILDVLACIGVATVATGWAGLGWTSGAGPTGVGIAAGILLVIQANLVRRYRVQAFVRPLMQVLVLGLLWTATALLITLFAQLLGSSQPWADWAWAQRFWIVGAVAIPAVHLAVGVLVQTGRRMGLFKYRVAVIGASSQAALKFLREQGDDARADYVIVGLFDDRYTRVPELVEDEPVVGDVNYLVDFARDHSVDIVFITIPWANELRNRQLVERLQQLPLDVVVAVDMEMEVDTRHPMKMVWMGGVPSIQVQKQPLDHGEQVIKKIEDYGIAVAALLALSPIMLAAAIAIKLTDRGPIFFQQDRFGLKNQQFKMWKFRTMYVDRGDPSGQQRTVADDDRITPVGKILRRYSIDELPQLFNVLSGEMSIVGPRAHAVAMTIGSQYYHEAIRVYVSRHRVKPGLTGWAQVNGSRGAVITMDQARERLRYDLEYVNNWSLWFDIKIMLKTALLVLFDRNAY